ncbi:MAG: MBL fold metallo-hydrolase [Gammaproteobacteria bacterium]
MDAEGTALAGYDLMRAKRSYREFLPVYEAAQNAYYVSPDVTYETEMTIELGSKEIRLLHFVGHTRGDAVVWLPQDRILITGDLVTLPVPFGGNDYPDSLIESLERILSMDAAIIVPGHGAVQYTGEQVRFQLAMYRSLMDQAAQAARDRVTLDEFRESLDLKRFKERMVGDDPELSWGWENYFYEEEVENAYRTARGER